MSENDQEMLWSSFAKAVFSTGLPLSVFESPYWINFFGILRPGFKLPSRDVLSTQLLDQEFTALTNEMENKCALAETIGIQADGWTNINHEGLIDVVYTTPEPILAKVIEKGANREDSQYVANQISKSIDDVGPSKVLGVETDNASVMTCAWKILKKKYEELGFPMAFYGCMGHLFNLFLEDLCKIPVVKHVIDYCSQFASELKNSHNLSSLLTTIQKSNDSFRKITQKKPGKTRWVSNLTCVESLAVNERALKLLAIDEKAKFKALTRASLLDEQTWVKIRMVIELLSDLRDKIVLIQSDTPHMELCVVMFDELKQHFEKVLRGPTANFTLLSETDIAEVFTKLESRRKKSLQPIHLAAHILDPKHRGKLLSKKEYTKGFKFIRKLAPRFNLVQTEVEKELTEYAAEDGFWKIGTLNAPVTHLSSWWKGVCKPTSLSRIASQIFKLHPTTAATERTFSTFGWIHNKLRNRLIAVRAGKLTFLACNLRLAIKE